MTVKGIRRRFYILTGAHTLAASIIWGVNTLFLLDSGLDIVQVFLVNAVFTAAMTLFEIPTGAVADTKGRRTSLILSSVMLFVGTLGYLGAGTWGGGFAAFAAASVFLGLAFTFFSGAAEAWAVDELIFLGEEGGGASLFARAATTSSITMLAGTVVGGLLGSLDYRIPYLLRAALFLLMLGLTLFAMPERGWKPDGRALSPMARVKSTLNDTVRYGLKVTSLRRLMGISFLLGTFLIWGFYALQPYITELAGKPGAAWLSGLVTALITLSQILGQLLVGRQNKQDKGFRKLVSSKLSKAMLIAAMGALITGLAGLNSLQAFLGTLLTPALAIVGLLLLMGSLGYAGPFLRDAFHSRIPSEKRATIVSLDSLVGSGGAIIGQPTLGALAGRFGISFGYLAGVALFLLTQPILVLFRKSEKADKK